MVKKRIFQLHIHSFQKWLPLALAVFLPIVTAGKGDRYTGLSLYHTLCNDIPNLLFYIPLFGVFSFSNILFYQKDEVIYRFLAYHSMWKRQRLAFLWDAGVFTVTLQSGIFFSHLVHGNGEAYRYNLLFLLAAGFLQFFTFFVMELLFMLLSSVSRNPFFGFLLTYMMVLFEKFMLSVNVGRQTVWLLGGLHTTPEHFFIPLVSVSVTGIAIMSLIPHVLSRRDYIAKEEET